MKNKCKKGFSFFFIVLTIGLILALFKIGIGGGATIKIPFTNINFSVGGAIGKKEVVIHSLPNYLKNRIGSNQEFFNHSSTMTIWLAEGLGTCIIGIQPDAPAIDLKISLLK